LITLAPGAALAIAFAEPVKQGPPRRIGQGLEHRITATRTRHIRSELEDLHARGIKIDSARVNE
jgi:hypothetical protein